VLLIEVYHHITDLLDLAQLGQYLCHHHAQEDIMPEETEPPVVILGFITPYCYQDI
jgi:hypothetical protein